MEQKCLKTNVYVNDILFCDSTEQAVDIDFTLPDFCPDISRIFKCNAMPRVASKSINGKTITIEGSVYITLIYADGDGNLCSYEYSYPFSKGLEMNSECAGANINCKVRCEYINCRAVTGRKVDIHGAVGIFVKVFKRKCTDIVSDFDDVGVELKRGVAPATVPMGYSEKYVVLEDELRIGQGMPSVKNIIRSGINSTVKETKVISGKTVVKGELNVCVIYCSDETFTPQSIKTVIPFSQIVDVEGINDSCECETKSEIAFFEAKPRISQGGECRSIAITAKVLLSCEGYCPNDVAVILDAFSRKYQSDITRNKIAFEKIIENVNETFSCKKNIELEESISSVVDLWCSVSSHNTKFENGEMRIQGVIVVGMIICNENDNAIYCEKPIEFEYKYPLGEKTGSLRAEPKIEILSCGYTITSANNIELRADVCVGASIYEKNEMMLISQMSIDESKPIVRKRSNAMTIYFPNGEECVWDIARIYNASVEEIMRINELENEKLKVGQMILVPVT